MNGPQLFPNLAFKDNSFELMNANFGLISVQHDNGGYIGTAIGGCFCGATGYSNYWEWYNVNASNNKINIRCFDMSGGGTVQYGNDIGTNLTTVPLTFNFDIGATGATGNRYSFLGASNVAQPAGYVACVDLRRVFRSQVATQTDALDEASANVVSVVANDFEVAGTPTQTDPSGTLAKSLQEVMGVRLSKFPAVLDIKENTFTKAALYIKWSWNNPYHGYSFPRMDAGGLCTGVGSLMTITGNTFFSVLTATTVDINPATGFSHSAMSATSVAPYMNIDFSNNVVKGKTGASPGAAANWDTWNGAVRFWHPDAESWFQNSSAVLNNFAELAGGFHVHQDYLRFLWNVRYNDLTEIYFRVTQARDGGYASHALATVLGVRASEFRRTIVGVPAIPVGGPGSIINNNGLSMWDGTSIFVSTPSMSPYDDQLDIFGLDVPGGAINIGVCPTVDDAYVRGGRDIFGDHGHSGEINSAMQEKVRNTLGLILSASSDRNKRVLAMDGSQVGV